MASSSRGRASSTGALALLVLSLTAAPACTTMLLFERGRLRERVERYEGAWSDGERLLVAYRAETVRVSEPDPAPGRGALRGAAFRLTDLRADHPVDEFPLERVDPARALTPEDAPVAITPEVRDGRDASFALHGEDGQTLRFHSAALTRYRTEGWVYPLVPLAFIADLVTTPIILAPALPIWVMGD